MRAVFSALLLSALFGNLTSAYGADAQVQMIICNKAWDPQCRNYPVTTAVPLSPQIAGAGQRYSFQLNDLTKEQLEKVFSLLGIDENKINLAPQ